MRYWFTVFIAKPALGGIALASLLLTATTQSTQAQAVRIEIENLGSSTDFFLTPLWVGLHDGSLQLVPKAPAWERTAIEAPASRVSRRCLSRGRASRASCSQAEAWEQVGEYLAQSSQLVPSTISVARPGGVPRTTFEIDHTPIKMLLRNRPPC